MKRRVIISIFTVICVFTALDSFFRFGYSSTAGAPAGMCGAPGDGNTTCKDCHTGPAAIPQSGMITSTIPPTGYVSGTTYTVTATITRPGHSRFGFQISPQKTNGRLAGTLANI